MTTMIKLSGILAVHSKSPHPDACEAADCSFPIPSKLVFVFICLCILMSRGTKLGILHSRLGDPLAGLQPPALPDTRAGVRDGRVGLEETRQGWDLDQDRLGRARTLTGREGASRTMRQKVIELESDHTSCVEGIFGNIDPS